METKELIEAVNAEAKSAINVATLELKADLSAKDLEIKGLLSKNEAIQGEVINIMAELKSMKESGTLTKENSKDVLLNMLESKAVEIKDIATKNRGELSINLETKATFNYANFTSTDFAPTLNEVADIKTRQPLIYELFRKYPLSDVNKTFRMAYQATAIRDAQNQIDCSAIATTTNVVLGTDVITLSIVSDLINVCLWTVDDLDFLYAMIIELLTSSIMLKVDQQLLNGVVATNVLGIANYSTTFVPTLVGNSYLDTVATANIVDLLDSMASRISFNGGVNGFTADIALVNQIDFFKMKKLKDADGNYLNHCCNVVTGMSEYYTSYGVKVIPHLLVAPNTAYVFDSSKGMIFTGKDSELVINSSRENNNNFETGTITLMGTRRMQFHVPTPWRSAFLFSADNTANIAVINI